MGRRLLQIVGFARPAGGKKENEISEYIVEATYLREKISSATSVAAAFVSYSSSSPIAPLLLPWDGSCNGEETTTM